MGGTLPTLALILVLSGVVLVNSKPSPTLDFLDPFLNIGGGEDKDKEKEKERERVGDSRGDFRGDFRGDEGFRGGVGGALAASGHVDAGLGDSLGFNADGSVAASKNFGIGLEEGNKGFEEGELEGRLGLGGDRRPGQQFMENGPHFEQDEHHKGHPNQRPLPLPHHPQPSPQRIIHPNQLQNKEPCKHPLPRPLVPYNKFQGPPPPPNQREGPFFKKQFREFRALAGKNKTTNSTEDNATKDANPSQTGPKSARAISPVENMDPEPVDVDKDGDIDEDDEFFLQHGRSLQDNNLPTAAVVEGKNSTKLSNSTPTLNTATPPKRMSARDISIPANATNSSAGAVLNNFYSAIFFPLFYLMSQIL